MRVTAGEWGGGFESGHVRSHTLQDDGKAEMRWSWVKYQRLEGWDGGGQGVGGRDSYKEGRIGPEGGGSSGSLWGGPVPSGILHEGA